MNIENTRHQDSEENQADGSEGTEHSLDREQLGGLNSDLQDKREKLHQITQRTRFTLIQNILMHPQQAPSLEELNYINPDKSRATIREHLEKLIDSDIIKKKSLNQSEAARGDPRSFYYLTTETRELLDQFGIIDIEDTLQYVYANADKSDKVLEYEHAPRPGE